MREMSIRREINERSINRARSDISRISRGTAAEHRANAPLFLSPPYPHPIYIVAGGGGSINLSRCSC